MTKKNYWKPHFVISESFHNGVKYYTSGISEVHYEDDVITGYSRNMMDVSMTDDDINFAVNESIGLMKIYHNALKNDILIETPDGLIVYKKASYRE